MDDLAQQFTDKKGRIISIGGDMGNIVAEDNQEEIGRFEFEIIDDHECGNLLFSCIIEEAYQRSGIGVEMMKLAEEWYGNFCITDHLSNEGAAFLNYCVKSVFKEEHESIHDDRY